MISKNPIERIKYSERRSQSVSTADTDQSGKRSATGGHNNKGSPDD